MFDTSVVKSHAISGPRRATFFVSILLHSIAVVAVLALTMVSTEMPAQPPKQFELYRPAQLPSPPPAAPAPRQIAQPQHQVAPLKPSQPRVQTAPPIIPDQTPQVESQPQSIGESASTTTDPSISGEGGNDPSGVPGGVGVGSGGTGTAPAGPYTPGGEVTAARVISRVEPRFPQPWSRAVRDATVVVQCIIGKDGGIHDIQIVHSSFPPLNDAVLIALKQWKFEPGRLHGQAVDTYFELTVKFQVR